jgi:hypothetical protein
MGGGLRLKSLTALAAGLPLVSTSLGVEGLKLLKNKHYLHAETTEEFANQVIRVLVSKKLAKKLGLSTQPYLKKYHDNDQNRLFLKKYSNIIKT